MIADAAQSLAGLLRDVLDVIRAEAGRDGAEAADYDPRRLLTSIAGVLRPSLRGRPLELRGRRRPGVPDALHGDAARVRQIVLNLASQRGQVHGARRGADRTPRVGGRHAADHGLRHRPRASPTRTSRGCSSRGRATTAGRGPGTGLGLSIARRLARAMGGDVTVVSRARRGLGVHAGAAAGRGRGWRPARASTRRPRWPRAACWWPRTTPRCGA